MNVGEQKVSKGQGAAVHSQLEVRLRNYQCSTTVLDSREKENELEK